MPSIVRWWFFVEVLGFIGWIAGERAFARFTDRGFAWSKPLGLLLVGGSLWFLTALGVLRNDLGGALIATFLVAGVAAVSLRASRAFPLGFGWRSALRAWWRRRWRLILIEELIFVLAFCAWSTVRAADPAAQHTEQPMDLMFLTAVSVSPTVPPEDPWLAGEPISYYYLGYWLIATLGRLAGQLPEVSYNLGQATWWGFLVSGTFGLGFHLTRQRLGRGASRRALAGGCLAAVSVAIAGNLHLTGELLRAGFGELASASPAGNLVGSHGSGTGPWLGGDWWWWRASRAVSDADLAGRPIEVITEFPLFSYLLGDDHPHLLSMPFLAVAAALSLAAARERVRGRSRAFPGAGWLAGQNRSALLLGAITVAALVPINTWDFPAGAALLLGGALLARNGALASSPALWRFALLDAGALGAWTALTTLPFLLTAQSQVQGLRPNLLHPTSAAELGIMFGAFLPGVILALRMVRNGARGLGGSVLRFTVGLFATAFTILALGYVWSWRTAGGRAWLAGLGAARELLPVAFDRWRRDGTALAIVLVLLATALTNLAGSAFRPPAELRQRPGERSARLCLSGILVLGLGLLATAELVYVQDMFGNRMNTVFKLWYQAWFFLGLTSAVGLATASRGGWVDRALRAGGIILLGFGLLYPVLALRSKTSQPRWTLDSLAHLAELSPEMLAASRWLRDVAPPGARILEAPGDSYHAEHNLLSATSGHATLLGWRGHEEQWRGASYSRFVAGRSEVPAQIFAAKDRQALAALLEQWRIEYVVYGPREREVYGAADRGTAKRLRTFMAPVFDSGAVTIFRRLR